MLTMDKHRLAFLVGDDLQEANGIGFGYIPCVQGNCLDRQLGGVEDVLVGMIRAEIDYRLDAQLFQLLEPFSGGLVPRYSPSLTLWRFGSPGRSSLTARAAGRAFGSASQMMAGARRPTIKTIGASERGMTRNMTGSPVN